jgi:hypothetical protein
MLIAIAVAFGSPVFAAERIELKPGKPVTIVPGKAYVLIELGGSAPMQLVKRASPEEKATWEAKRAVERPKAIQRYQKRSASYAVQVRDWNEMSVSDRMSFQKPEKPEYVDAQSFYMDPPELKHVVNILGRRTFDTSDGRRMVVLQIEPGDYDVYSLSDGKMGARCLCMGSVGFTAVAGKVMTVGSFEPMDGSVREFRFIPARKGDAVPAEVANYGVDPARIHAVGSMPNIFGARISRVAPVDGLLNYKLGVPLDASGKPAGSFQ